MSTRIDTVKSQLQHSIRTLQLIDQKGKFFVVAVPLVEAVVFTFERIPCRLCSHRRHLLLCKLRNHSFSRKSQIVVSRLCHGNFCYCSILSDTMGSSSPPISRVTVYRLTEVDRKESPRSIVVMVTVCLFTVELVNGYG